jgi:hypothetical protein
MADGNRVWTVCKRSLAPPGALETSWRPLLVTGTAGLKTLGRDSGKAMVLTAAPRCKGERLSSAGGLE